MRRASALLAVALLYGCGTQGPSPEPTPFLGIVALDIAPGTGLGVGPQGGCGSVGFSDLRLFGDAMANPPVWLESTDDRARVVIRWPPGFSARFEPELVIYDARRQPVLRNRDLLTNASGYPERDGRRATLFSFNGVDYPCE